MKTIDFAHEIADLLGASVAEFPEVYRRCLLFASARSEGYGVGPNDGERGEARAYATREGFYWLPCIVCGEWYGGHEKPNGSITLNKGHSVCTCPNCVEEAERINKLFPKGLERPC